jgi:hypothetical protein
VRGVPGSFGHVGFFVVVVLMSREFGVVHALHLDL